MTPTHRQRHLDEGLFQLKLKPGPGLCGVKGCRKARAKQKMGLCHCCWQHRWRMQNPKRSAFSTLRDHAKRRGIEFSISYDYFLGLTDAYNFFDHEVETRGERLTIDRRDACKGYVRSNLVILTLSENVAKGNTERHLPAHVREILERKRRKAREAGGFIKPLEDYEPF